LKPTSTLKWRILSKSSSKIELIAATEDSNPFYLMGFRGYNNAVQLLNNACKEIYSNSELGAVARNLNMEDIAPHYKGTSEPRGNQSTITTNKAYPIILAQEENGNLNGTGYGTLKRSQMPSTGYIEQDKKMIAEKSVIIKNTHYAMSLNASDFGDYADLFKSSSQSSVSWVASRCTMGYQYITATFMIFSTSLNQVYYSKLYESTGTSTANKKGLRPIVTLDPNTVSIGSTGSGTSDDPFSITRK